MRRDAIFSEDRKYRYILSRIWDETKPTVLFIGLNPSTADETEDDPTIRKCINFAKTWGYGGIYMANLFAFRSTNPENLRNEQDPVGSDNNSFIKKYLGESERTIVCWGNKGNINNRSEEVYNLLVNSPHHNSLHCLKINQTGEPHHPLYLPLDIEAIPYTR